MREYIQNLNIKDCNQCEEIQRLQHNHHITAAPLFWQGRGRPGIPLIIIGINPSVVGTANEPQRGCDFESYFNYYQNRAASEVRNVRLANARLSYGPEFRAEDFNNGFTIENLCQAVRRCDSYNLSNNSIEALNTLMKQSGLYEKLIAANRNKVPSNKLKENIDAYAKEKEEKRLLTINRLVLEEYYPQETPKLPNVPQNYWTRCHKIAGHLTGRETPRWENYVLMEAIHCFYNRASDLSVEEAKTVSNGCFERYTKNMLKVLKPKKIILLGTEPYKVFKPYLLNKEIDNYKFCAMNLDGLRIPVLRHLHPNQPVKKENGGFYRMESYAAFNSFCKNFDYTI